VIWGWSEDIEGIKAIKMRLLRVKLLFYSLHKILDLGVEA